MRIVRDIYLEKLKCGVGNGMIKVITGIRRCGKSYLLSELFREYLASIGIDEAHIIEVALDDRANIALRDPDAMMSYVKSRITDSGQYFILLDEVQYMAEFEDVLNSFLHIRNVEVYVTGSNSHFLSTDIVTEFRLAKARVSLDGLVSEPTADAMMSRSSSSSSRLRMSWRSRMSLI